MSKWGWSVARDDQRWAAAKLIASADSNDHDMIDAVQHVKEVSAQ